MYKLLHIPTGTYIYVNNLFGQQDKSCLFSREEVNAKLPSTNYEIAVFSSLNEVNRVLKGISKTMFPIYFNTIDSEILNYEPIEF